MQIWVEIGGTAILQIAAWAGYWVLYHKIKKLETIVARLLALEPIVSNISVRIGRES